MESLFCTTDRTRQNVGFCRQKMGKAFPILTKRTPPVGVYCNHVAARGRCSFSFVYIEIYIDQFFAEQFLAGWILLYLAAFAGKLRRKKGRLPFAAAVGAAAQCLYVVTGWKWISAAGYLVIAALAFMPGERIKGILFLMISTVCFGGVMESVFTILSVNTVAGCMISGMILLTVWKWCRRNRRKTEEEITLLLEWAGRQIKVRALVDTGNHLKEPATGRPVSILDRESAAKLLEDGWEARKGCFLIPYHSIGKELGWMQGVSLDRMIIPSEEGEREIRNPVFAISSGRVNLKDKYQVILNPEHIRR